jgi:putative transposase
VPALSKLQHYRFENLADARRKIEAWRLDYNQARPHSGLAYRTPEEVARAWTPSGARAGRRTEYDQPKGILL